MSQSGGVEVEGAERLQASLADVAGELGNLSEAGAKAGQAVKQRAASNAPVDSGHLARSIRADWTGTTVDVAASAPYARFVEYGTIYVTAQPFMRPALEAAQSEIVAAYAAEVQKDLYQVKGA